MTQENQRSASQPARAPGRRRKLRVVLVPPLQEDGLLPLAAGLLKACAERDPFLRRNTDIIVLEPWASAAAVPARAAALKPDLVGFTVYGRLKEALEAAAGVKRLCGARIVFGGPMSGAAPAEELFAGGAVDCAVAGEGEESFPALLRALLGRGALGEVRGLSYMAGGAVVHGPPARPVKELAPLPSPYLKGLFKWRDYPRIPLEMSRGCREACLYCSVSGNFRRFPFRRVEAELDRILKDFPRLRTLFLTDPDVCLNPDMAPLLRLLAAGAARRGITVEIQANPLHLDERMARALNDGAFSLGIGVQSISGEACRLVNRRADLRGLRRKLALLAAEAPRARIVLSFIIGLPGDTYEGGLANFDWGLSLNAGLFFHRLRLYPGTPLGRMAGRAGLKAQPRDPYHVLGTPSLPAAGLRRLSRLARGLSLGANLVFADKYLGFLFRYIASGRRPEGKFPRIELCRRLGRLARADAALAAAVAETDSFIDDGDWSGLGAEVFGKGRPGLIRALAGLERGAGRRVFAARYVKFCASRLAWDGVNGGALRRLLELAAGKSGGPSLLVCGAASPDPARFPGAALEVLVEEKFGFFPSSRSAGRAFADRTEFLPGLAAAVGAAKFSRIFVSQVLSALPRAERAAALKLLLAAARPGAKLLVADDGLGYPEFGADWELTGKWHECPAGTLEADLAAAGWRLRRTLPFGGWRVICAERTPASRA